MKTLYVIRKLFIIVLILGCFAAPVFADDQNNTNKNNQDNSVTADKIYSDHYILGFPIGSGSVSDTLNVKKMEHVLSSNDIVWAIVCLLITVIGAVVIFGTVGAHALNALKVVKAGFEDNPEAAIEKMHRAKKSSTALMLSLAWIIGCLAVFIVGLSLF